jgi:hypothetical protein
MRKTHVLILLLPILSCVFPKLAGTSTETDTGCIIEGLVRYKNGAGVANASATLHDQRKTHMISLTKRSVLIRSKKTTTNINGFFQIDSVDTGRFFVEFNDHDSLGAVVPTTVNKGDTLIQIEPVLERCGSLQGKISPDIVNVNPGMIVYLPEIQRSAIIDSSNTFAIQALPVGNYQLAVVDKDSIIWSAPDTLRIPITANDTTRIISFGSKTGTITINGQVVEQPNNKK